MVTAEDSRKPNHPADAPEAPGPVDLSRLARQTGGDRALEREVLTLFLSKSLADLGRLNAAPSEKERREVAHAIVGSARAIGADTVARLAADVETGTGDRGRALADLESAVAEARRFLSEYLSGQEIVRV